MDSLANYGSDDDYDDSSDEQQKESHQIGSNRKDVQARKSDRPESQADANYEEVQMDLSEESNDGSHNGRDRESEDERRRSPNDDRSKDDYKGRRGEDRYRDRSRSRDRRAEDRMRDKKDERYSSKSDRYSREYRKDSYRDRRSRRSSSRDRRRSGSRDRRRSGSRDRRRSSSRERRYSRSPKRDRSRRSRSRSRSRGRYGGPQRRYGYSKNNGSRNDSGENSGENQSANKDRFFMPGITGKYRDQIEKRKLLWQKKDPQKQQDVSDAQPSTASSASTSRVTKIWEATTFAQDQDGKVASKFKRLMGIKGQTDSAPVPPVDIIKKQEEMFSSMEQQYEVARTATHTMRGVGLGFSSSYPR